jgi:hypothetical protein
VYLEFESDKRRMGVRKSGTRIRFDEDPLGVPSALVGHRARWS